MDYQARELDEELKAQKQEADYPSVKRMENARRVNMNGPYNFRIYDLTNTDMKSSNSGVDPDALRYMKLKIDNHCWREFKDEIDCYSMAFDFDDSISDDYEAYFVVHLEVKNFENAVAQPDKEFGVKAMANSKDEEKHYIGLYPRIMAGEERQLVQYGIKTDC